MSPQYFLLKKEKILGINIWKISQKIMKYILFIAFLKTCHIYAHWWKNFLFLVLSSEHLFKCIVLCLRVTESTEKKGKVSFLQGVHKLV